MGSFLQTELKLPLQLARFRQETVLRALRSIGSESLLHPRLYARDRTASVSYQALYALSDRDLILICDPASRLRLYQYVSALFYQAHLRRCVRGDYLSHVVKILGLSALDHALDQGPQGAGLDGITEPDLPDVFDQADPDQSSPNYGKILANKLMAAMGQCESIWLEMLPECLQQAAVPCPDLEEVDHHREIPSEDAYRLTQCLRTELVRFPSWYAKDKAGEAVELVTKAGEQDDQF